MRSTTVALIVLLSATALSAHVTIQPKESMATMSQRYTVRVPTETDFPTLSVELEIPAGVTVTEVPSGDGYTVETKKEGSRIVAITWKTNIKPKERAEFFFTATNPANPVDLKWNAHQLYGDGTTVHWTGVEGDRRPASVTKIVPHKH